MPSFAEAKSFAVAPAQAPVRCGRMASLVVVEGLPFRGPGSTPGNSENNFSNEPWQILVLLIYMTSLCIIDCIYVLVCVGQKVSMKKNPTFESDIYIYIIYQSIMKHRNP